jgi:hypothetical protein
VMSTPSKGGRLPEVKVMRSARAGKVVTKRAATAPKSLDVILVDKLI